MSQGDANRLSDDDFEQIDVEKELQNERRRRKIANQMRMQPLPELDIDDFDNIDDINLESNERGQDEGTKRPYQSSATAQVYRHSEKLPRKEAERERKKVCELKRPPRLMSDDGGSGDNTSSSGGRIDSPTSAKTD